MLNELKTKYRNIMVEKIRRGEYKQEPNPCPCGARLDSKVAAKDRYDIPITTLLCLKCGLMRSDPYYSAETLAKFYNNEYRPLYAGNWKSTDDFFSEQRTFGRNIRTFLEKEFYGGPMKGKKVFEVGCGAGGILEAFREIGNSVAGCDYGKEYLKFGKGKGLNLAVGGVETLRQFGQADLIILNHTLEHLPRPRETLEKIRSLLAPAGILYVALPGIFSIHDTYKGNLMTYLQNAHVWHFTLKTLSALLADAGFTLLAGNEIIQAVYRPSANALKPEPENPQKILKYLGKIKRFRWYYAGKKFSLKHALLQTLRKMPVVYNVTRSIYRKF